tara:strand:- start:1704 stop:4040 length:2337 start_codon:yes stop_codon:yes gene_type:complete
MTSAFQKSLRKEEDRIDRKRKENREAFEKFREMRIKNGDSVTAEDFQRYRQNLAGGDNFMLQSMGPGHMLEDIAKRTNEQSLLTRTKEDASFVEAQEKIKNTFDTFVGDNLDADPTDMNGSKKKFMALFNENPELGEEIWNQNKGRFSEALLAGRVKSAQEFHDLLLEDVHTKDEAQKIMIANGVPAWKQASIMSIMERKQNKFGGDTQSKAIELANGFVPNNVRFFDQMEIDKQVVLIMQRAKVDASIIGQTAFDDLKANITSVIKTKVDNANAAQIETDTRTFNQTISSNAMFIKAGMTNGWDSQELLDIYNTHRRNYGLSEATSVDDPNFKDVAHIANIHNRTNYKKNFQEEVARVEKRVDDQVESIAKNINAEASGFDKKSSGFIAISGMINQGLMLLPNVDPTEVRAIIENQFGADAVNSDKSDVETIKQIRQALSNLFISKQKFRAQLMEQSMVNVGYPPDTNFDQVSRDDIKEFGQSFTAYMRTQRAKMTVNIDPESPQFTRILSNLEEEADVYIQKMLAFYRKSKGAFETFGTGTDGTTITMEKRLEELEATLIQQKDDMLKDLRNGDQRGTKLPPASYEPTGTQSGLNQQGYVKMKVALTKRVFNDATGDYEEVPVTYKDTDIPVKAGDVVKIDQNGDITSYSQNQSTITSGATNIISRITTDPGKVGQELLGGGRDFSAFMPPSMGGGIDTNTTNQQMAQTIKNMYQAFIQSGTPLPSYPTPGSFGRSTTQVTNEREFAKAILSGINQYNSRGYGFTNQGILGLFPQR